MAKPGEFVAEYIVTAADMNGLWPDWTTWAPTYTNLTIGNGTVTARYHHLGSKVTARWSFVLGSTSAVGSAPEISVPVAPHAGYTDARDVVGDVALVDTGTGLFDGRVFFGSSLTNFGLFRSAVSGSNIRLDNNINSTSPFTWTTNDQIRFTAIYEAA